VLVQLVTASWPIHVLAANAAVSWADQMTAYGTVGAVATSLCLSIYGAVIAWREKRRSASDASERAERSQAEKLHWWHELCSEHPIPWDGELSLREIYKNLGLVKCWGEVLVVENMSDAPVHAVVLHTPRHYLDKLAAFMPGELGPGARRTFHVSGFGASLIGSEFRGEGMVFFSDAQGRRWEREKSGTLRRSLGTVVEQEKLAGEAQGHLFRTLRSIGDEHEWIEPARGAIADALWLLATPPDMNTPSRTAYVRKQIANADEAAFRMLQALPSRHWARRTAVIWWEWRSGKLSLADVATNPHHYWAIGGSRVVSAARRGGAL